jgi:hypothetical protein
MKRTHSINRNDDHVVMPTDVAFLQFTSGSTSGKGFTNTKSGEVDSEELET